jgi:hypothetical protein
MNRVPLCPCFSGVGSHKERTTVPSPPITTLARTHAINDALLALLATASCQLGGVTSGQRPAAGLDKPCWVAPDTKLPLSESLAVPSVCRGSSAQTADANQPDEHVAGQEGACKEVGLRKQRMHVSRISMRVAAQWHMLTAGPA